MSGPSIPDADPRCTIEATRSFDQMEALHDPLLGKVVGNYHLLSRIGEGSFGAVYKARDIKLDRLAAVKFLHESTSAERRAAFLREAQAIARLSRHPGIVDIHAWGEHEGRCYIALSLAAGSVRKLLLDAPGGLPPERALHLVRQAAGALAFAHGHGIIHGDIKPENLLLTGRGDDVQLCDFGLSHLDHGETPDGVLRLAGTPGYLAPERLGGTPVSATADLYALGVTLYELLCGERPYEGGTVSELFRNIGAKTPIALRARRPDLPDFLLTLVDKATAANPEDRFPDAAAFVGALEDAQSSLRAASRSRRRAPSVHGWRYRAAMFAAAALAVAAILFLPESPFFGRNAGAPVLAEARLHLNNGEYDAAREDFEAYLADFPADSEARYGLAYAFLLEGEHARAADEFARVGEAMLREEGAAAVAYMRDGEEARPVLEKAGAATHGYPSVLLAQLDLMAGQYQQAADRLAAVDERGLSFVWQERQYLQTLGQARYKLGDLEGAREVFARLEQEGGGNAPQIAREYLELTRRGDDAARREAISGQIQRIKALRDAAPPAAPADAWSSRPLRVWLLPVEARGGAALESGLADVLPWKIAKTLLASDSIALDPVERGLTEQILAEQELAGQLGSTPGAVRLGQVLGARLLLQCKAARVFGKELLNVTLVDTETTALIPVGEYPVDRRMDLDAWTGALTGDIWNKVRERYPLRGRVAPEPGGARLSIGELVGVRPGMTFDLLAGPGRAHALPEAAATVLAEVGADHAAVSISGADLESAPAGGWYAEARPGV